MTRKDLIGNIARKGSFLCVGLDPDIKKIPAHLLTEENPLLAFNKAIIDATAPYCVAFKPNLAFFESMGVDGWVAFEETVKYIRQNYPVKPFLGYPGKWVILLALTSNPGSADFQMIPDGSGMRLFERVLDTSAQWAGPDEMMYVVGATRGSMFADIRRHAPKSFLLVPGVGAQGGSLEEVVKYGMLPDGECGLLVNSSRGIIYASSGSDFAEAAGAAAKALALEMKVLL